MSFEILSNNLFHKQNALPNSVAEKILLIFKKNREWTLINQKKESIIVIYLKTILNFYLIQKKNI